MRLSRSTGSRLGLLGALGVALFGLSLGAVLVQSDGAAALPPLLARTVRWSLWLGVGPLALAIANARPERDRADGVEALAALRGISRAHVEVARVLAAVVQTTLRCAVPIVGLCAALALLFWQAAPLLLALAVGFCGVSLAAGLVVGGVASLCGRLGGRRGRTLLLAAVLLPWLLAGELGHPFASMPGLLDLVLSAAVDWASVVGGLR
ncbi:MAG: hypothetical protein JRI23_13290 [Deltaproteobacteria bacterium]|jgi:hypothetical protein|nr:hypothetical protein [Deltaproteobacteria bacterium]MBW2532698.1 hypothetical protein [Deltaproteobacteria bacterium]